VARLVLQLDPSAAWLRSSWPIDRIWQANQAGADPDARVDLATGEARLEIRRMGERVAFRRLEAAEYAFRTGLGRGSTLEMAAGAAFAEDQSFDLAGALRALLDEALPVGFTLVPEGAQEGESR
jgi:hypothetical protein